MARTSKSNAPVTDRDVLADIYLNTNCYKVPGEGQRSPRLSQRCPAWRNLSNSGILTQFVDVLSSEFSSKGSLEKGVEEII